MSTRPARRQYDLVRRARDLGWPPEAITVIDQDQGRSGASADGRDGFQALVAEVGLGHARRPQPGGLTPGPRLQRLVPPARAVCPDRDVGRRRGRHLRPGQYDDRLLLGFKGTMSEAELHWLRARLLGGKLEKARQGALRVKLPTRAGLRPRPDG